MAVLKAHREAAYIEKTHFYLTREKALTDSSLICVGMDNLSKHRTRLINLGAQLKGHGADDLRQVEAILDVSVVAGLPHHFFLVDPKLPDNANLIMEMLHITLQTIAQERARDPEPDAILHVDRQVDGAKVNKNLSTFAYFAWLIGTRQTKRAAVSKQIWLP